MDFGKMILIYTDSIFWNVSASRNIYVKYVLIKGLLQKKKKKKNQFEGRKKRQMIEIAWKVHDAIRCNAASWRSSSNWKKKEKEKERFAPVDACVFFRFS